MGPTINVAWNKALVPLFTYTAITLFNKTSQWIYKNKYM